MLVEAKEDLSANLFPASRYSSLRAAAGDKLQILFTSENGNFFIARNLASDDVGVLRRGDFLALLDDNTMAAPLSLTEYTERISSNTYKACLSKRIKLTKKSHGINLLWTQRDKFEAPCTHLYDIIKH